MEKVRILRILEYVGTREAVEKTLERSNVPLNGQAGYGDLIVKSAMIGTFPEIFEETEGENK